MGRGLTLAAGSSVMGRVDEQGAVVVRCSLAFPGSGAF